MIYGNRDVGINYIRTRNNHTCYGMGIGIMVLGCAQCQCLPLPGAVRDCRGGG